MPAPKELDPSTSLAALYGVKVRKLRTRAGWTQRELGDKIPIAHSRIAQFELGNETPPQDVSAALDKLLGAEGDLCDLWGHIKRTPFPDWVRKFMEREARASAMHKYMAHSVPGLLQTEAYARELLRHGNPWSTSDEIEEKVTARLDRQGLLARPTPPLLWVVLDEAVIRRPVGGAVVMREQLAYVIECAKAPHVEVQVMPFAAGGHSVMGGSLTLLSFENAPAVAYIEGDSSGELVEDKTAVARHSYRYDLVHAMALSPAASTAFIRKAMEGFSTCTPHST
ncbi:helix-turn-helix domain-containing protein [Streptomyces sp. H27-D2]|uniref:helix-turn-helix domain-containing protein n=1 Tax=Streptomyces sp. H27-D2 TaxID=3046304 RepID=UPI002DBA2921|nr:helix-turn-helix transcriptional regulator [Streptomyces sp. H27-D2]MEC4014959.1 helix-turn-helix transcriptional regulator [Streptomyces sp. H27-D2]